MDESDLVFNELLGRPLSSGSAADSPSTRSPRLRSTAAAISRFAPHDGVADARAGDHPKVVGERL